MKFTLEIKMDGRSFLDDPSKELARVLRELSADIDCMFLEVGDRDDMKDRNGNIIGHFVFTEEAKP